MRFPTIKGFDEAAFQKYLKNTGWLMFGKMLSLVVNLVVTKYLGPESFGELSFALALVTITSAVSALGLDSFIIREIIHDPQQRDEILGTALWLRLLANAFLIPVTMAIYLAYHHFFEKSGQALTLIVGLLTLTAVFKSFNIIDSYFQSQVKSKYVVHVQNITLIITALLKVAVVYFALPLLFLVIVLVFDALLLALGLVLIYHYQGFSMLKWTFNAARARFLLRKSSPLILSALMVSIYMKIDQLMLKQVGSAAVGIYSAAANLSEAWYFIPTAIIMSIFPAIINARRTDPERYNKRLINLYDLLVWISLPVAILISIFANPIIHIIYSNRFEGAGSMLAIHIWSGVFVFLGLASSQYLLAEGFTKISFYRTLCGALINIGLNLWLIPSYGGIGASVATLIACIVSTFYILLVQKTRQQGINMLKSLFLVSALQKIFKH